MELEKGVKMVQNDVKVNAVPCQCGAIALYRSLTCSISTLGVIRNGLSTDAPSTSSSQGTLFLFVEFGDGEGRRAGWRWQELSITAAAVDIDGREIEGAKGRK